MVATGRRERLNVWLSRAQGGGEMTRTSAPIPPLPIPPIIAVELGDLDL